MTELLNTAAKVLGMLAAIVAFLAYFFDQELAAFAALFVACIIGIFYAAWVVLSRASPEPSPIIGHEGPRTSVPKFSPMGRILAALAIILQAVLLVAASSHIIRITPLLESIAPAATGETLVLISRLDGPHDSPDVSLQIVTSLRQELQRNPLASLATQQGAWRVEHSKRVMSPAEAVRVGKSLHALLVITGHHDRKNVQLAITIPAERLASDADENSEALALARELGLTTDPISFSAPSDSLQSKLTALALFVRGFHLYSIGDVHNAQEALTEAINGGSNNEMFQARATYLRGVCAYTLDDFTAAERDLKGAVELGLDTPEVHWRLGDIYLQTDRLEDADRAFEQALKRSGYSSAAYYRSGMTIFSWRRRIRFFTSNDPEQFKAADDSFRLALEKNSRNVDAAIARGQLHMQFSGSHGSGFVLEHSGVAATEFLTSALENNPQSGALRSMLSKVLFIAGRVDEAKAMLLEGVKKGDERTGEFLIGLSIIHEQSNDTNAAIEYLKRFLETKLERDGLWWERATARWRLARLEGKADAELFRTFDNTEATQRRERFIKAIGHWSGRVWNRDFHGSRSTKDAFLFLLTEAEVIPQVGDRGSADILFQTLLRERDSSQWTPNVPVWFESGIISGGFFGITTAQPNEFQGFYLEAEKNGKIKAFDEPVTDIGNNFLYTVYDISMERVPAFSGD